MAIFPTWPPITGEPEFSRTCGFRRMLEDHYILHFKVIPAKTNDLISQKNWKTLILGHFDHYNCPAHFLRVFPKNPALSLFIPYGSLPSCKISEKNSWANSENLRHGHTDRHTDGSEFIGPFSGKPGVQLCHFCKDGSFLEKSDFATHNLIWTSNFMYNIRKKQSNFEKKLKKSIQVQPDFSRKNGWGQFWGFIIP
jgi:hypothetical protein